MKYIGYNDYLTILMILCYEAFSIEKKLETKNMIFMERTWIILMEDFDKFEEYLLHIIIYRKYVTICTLRCSKCYVYQRQLWESLDYFVIKI